MRMVDPIIQEFNQEAPTTRRVLERLPLDKKDWKPHPRSMSLGQLASWMANAPGWTAGVVLLGAGTRMMGFLALMDTDQI